MSDYNAQIIDEFRANGGANQLERFPQMAEYAENAGDRTIPVMRLTHI